MGFALESICGDDRLEYEFFDSKMKSQFGSLERADLWAKSLGLRYTPNFSAQHMLGHMLIVRTESKTAWVNLETQQPLHRSSRPHTVLGLCGCRKAAPV